MNKRNLKVNVVLTSCALIFSLFIGYQAFAQTVTTSSVSGTVTDAQGNVLTRATVVLLNPEKNFTRTQTTNESGTFSFNAIPPDTYMLEVSASGFKKSILKDVQALISKPTEANVQLEVGGLAETVIVTSGGNESLINTQDASLGNNIVSRQITQLPLEARDVNSLLTLQPARRAKAMLPERAPTNQTLLLTAWTLTKRKQIRREAQRAEKAQTPSEGFQILPIPERFCVWAAKQ